MSKFSEHRLSWGWHLQRRGWVKHPGDVNFLSESHCRAFCRRLARCHMFAVHLLDNAEGSARGDPRKIQSATEGEGRFAAAGMRGLGRRISHEKGACCTCDARIIHSSAGG